MGPASTARQNELCAGWVNCDYSSASLIACQSRPHLIRIVRVLRPVAKALIDDCIVRYFSLLFTAGEPAKTERKRGKHKQVKSC